MKKYYVLRYNLLDKYFTIEGEFYDPEDAKTFAALCTKGKILPGAEFKVFQPL